MQEFYGFRADCPPGASVLPFRKYAERKEAPRKTKVPAGVSPVLRAVRVLRTFLREHPLMQVAYPSTLAGACGNASWVLVRMLRELGVSARCVEGYVRSTSTEGMPWSSRHLRDFHHHVWAMTGDVVLDVTASQFDGPPMYIGPAGTTYYQAAYGTEVEREIEFAMRTVGPYTLEGWKLLSRYLLQQVRSGSKGWKPYEDAQVPAWARPLTLR